MVVFPTKETVGMLANVYNTGCPGVTIVEEHV